MNEQITDHFRKWLRVGTGCSFAASLAKGGRIAYEAHDEMPPVHEVDTNLDQYAAGALSAILIFPFLTSEAGLVDILHALRAGSPRWKIRHRGNGHTGSVLVGVDWSTANGDVSDTMGFAPLPSMPVPRRAPYFAIGAWPGPRLNPERGTSPTPRAKPGLVSFLDAEHQHPHDTYESMWIGTEAAVHDLMIMPADAAKLYRRVAFVLSAEVENTIIFDQ